MTRATGNWDPLNRDEKENEKNKKEKKKLVSDYHMATTCHNI
jgi:hypothetical protein